MGHPRAWQGQAKGTVCKKPGSWFGVFVWILQSRCQIDPNYMKSMGRGVCAGQARRPTGPQEGEEVVGACILDGGAGLGGFSQITHQGACRAGFPPFTGPLSGRSCSLQPRSQMCGQHSLLPPNTCLSSQQRTAGQASGKPHSDACTVGAPAGSTLPLPIPLLGG